MMPCLKDFSAIGNLYHAVQLCIADRQLGNDIVDATGILWIPTLAAIWSSHPHCTFRQ